jgi:hypothetical protein
MIPKSFFRPPEPESSRARMATDPTEPEPGIFPKSKFKWKFKIQIENHSRNSNDFVVPLVEKSRIIRPSFPAPLPLGSDLD